MLTIMIIQSLFIGILFGVVWATFFVGKANTSLTTTQPLSTLSIATSTIRYILLALLLGFLVMKNLIILIWWLAGFMIAFWILLLLSIQKKNRETK